MNFIYVVSSIYRFLATKYTMRKRVISIILIVILGLSLIFIGCVNSVSEKSIEQAKVSIENRNYTKAKTLLELTLEEDPENEEAKILYDIINSYEKANKAMNDNKVEEAKKILDNINRDYINYSIKIDIDNLKSKVNVHYKELEKINTYLKEAKRLYDNEKYSGCKIFLSNNLLGSSENNIAPNKYMTKEQRQKALELSNKCNIALAREDVSNPPEEENPKPTKGTKEEYLKKLDALQAQMVDLEDLYSSPAITDMKQAASIEYTRWDNILNEIYSLLKVKLSTDEMKELEKKEVEWIKYRDKTAKNASDKFNGGTMAGLEYTMTLSKLTKERCYELVNTYMK